MKSLTSIFFCAMIGISQIVSAQQAQVKRILPLDAETNCQVRYYYFPNLEAYFDKATDLYIFRDKGEWKKEKEIPSGYRGYGLFNKASVAIDDYDDDDIEQLLEKHRKMFPYNSLKRNRSVSATASTY